MPFVEVDINAIIEEKCKDPEFKREYEKLKDRYRAIDRVRMMKK